MLEPRPGGEQRGKRRGPEMADVFISYSRRDEEFVERLRETLADNGKDVWVDREDIGPAVEWRREIELGIEGADIFTFVITPDALRSEPCRPRARTRGLDAEADRPAVAPRARRPAGAGASSANRNFIYFRTDEEFAPGSAALLAAIDNLPEWVREHTRLLERAEEWEHSGHDRGALLRGGDLRQAEAWLVEQAAHEELQPTPLQTEYILASRRAATRRQWVAAAAAVGGLVIAAVAVVALLQRADARAERDQQLRVSQSRQLASTADRQLEIDPELSVLLAQQAASISPTVEAERSLRRALARSPVEVAMRGHRAWVGHAAFSPDGERVVTVQPRRPGRALGRDVRRQYRLAAASGSRGLGGLQPRGDLVATASRDGTARIWDGVTGEPRATLGGHAEHVSRVEFSPDGRQVVTTSREATARIWDPETGDQVAVLRGHKRWVTRLEFTADGRSIVTGSDDGTVRVWDAASGAPLSVMRPRAGPVTALAVSTSGSQIFTASSDSHGRHAEVIWDPTGRMVRRLPRAGGEVYAAAYSDSGRAAWRPASFDGTVRVWAAASGRLLRTLHGHTGPISDLSFSEDGGQLVTASGDGSAKLWDLLSGRLVEDLIGHRGWVTTAAFAPDGRTVLTASQDGTARIWDATAGRAQRELHTGVTATSATFSDDGRFVLTAGVPGSGSGTLRPARQ